MWKVRTEFRHTFQGVAFANRKTINKIVNKFRQTESLLDNERKLNWNAVFSLNRNLNIPLKSSLDTLRRRPGSIVSSFKFQVCSAPKKKNNSTRQRVNVDIVCRRMECMHNRDKLRICCNLGGGGGCYFMAYGYIDCATRPIVRRNIYYKELVSLLLDRRNDLGQVLKWSHCIIRPEVTVARRETSVRLGRQLVLRQPYIIK
jgi:hypothetical protein